jgi:hypothetical protein
MMDIVDVGTGMLTIYAGVGTRSAEHSLIRSTLDSETRKEEKAGRRKEDEDREGDRIRIEEEENRIHEIRDSKDGCGCVLPMTRPVLIPARKGEGVCVRQGRVHRGVF